MRAFEIENRDELLKEAKSIVTGSIEREFQHKVEIVTLALKGISPRELEEKGIVSRPTLSLWLKSVREGGFETLRNTQSIGRPKKLSNEEIEKLTEDMKKDPASFGYKKWDGKTIHEHIQASFGEDICLRHCQRLKHELLKAGKLKNTEHS